MADLQKLAAVFDAFADYVDENEAKKVAAFENTRKARIDKIAAMHLASHGEEMNDVIRQKLAKTDDATLDYIEESLSKTAGAVEPLGGGATTDEPLPKTVKEAADAADQRFVDWIVS